jgi:hypothetical protein
MLLNAGVATAGFAAMHLATVGDNAALVAGATRQSNGMSRNDSAYAWFITSLESRHIVNGKGKRCKVQICLVCLLPFATTSFQKDTPGSVSLY